MKERIAVYAGTFDVFTNGHLHILTKASALFDIIYLVVADNVDKKCMFSLDERIKMAEAAVAFLPTKIGVNDNNLKKFRVVKLPPSVYLVNFANKMGACCLIRGIRDNIDFAYEEKLHRTNLAICPQVETIYIMPDDTHSLISSSWVKGLIGQNGWRDIVAPAVPKNVFESLKKAYLKKEVDAFVSEVTGLIQINNASLIAGSGKSHMLLLPSNFSESIVSQYSRKGYHNYDHVLDGLEAFKELFEEGHFATKEEKLTTIFSWLLHDYEPDEEASAAHALSICPNVFPKRDVAKFIAATKHSEKFQENTLSNEAIFASVDLLVLAWPWEKYCGYVKQIVEEYKHYGEDKFVAGRIAFLEKMLAKETIFPYPSFEKRFGKQARSNMNCELHNLLEQQRAYHGVFS